MVKDQMSNVEVTEPTDEKGIRMQISYQQRMHLPWARRLLLMGVASLTVLAGISLAMAASVDEDNLPKGSTLLWTPEQKIIGYRSMEEIKPVRAIGRGEQVHALTVAAHQIAPSWTWKGQAMDVDKYMQAMRASGVIVLKDGQVVLERYGLGRKASDGWQSASVAKSVTSILIGAAIQDGYIKSLDALATDYIPELKDGGYEGVTVRQLLTMTSGVKWNEDYEDTGSDVFQAYTAVPETGMVPIVSYMRHLPKASKPGEKFVYSTGETDLAGILLSNAVGKPMSQYLSSKLWRPYGMEKEAFWQVDSTAHNYGGFGLSVTLRDYARIGQFMLDGGKVRGVQVLPPDFVADATSAQVSFPQPLYGANGYGYFWWIYKDYYAALGHGGQAIAVYPKDGVVVAINSAWPEPETSEDWEALHTFVEALHTAAVSVR